MHAHRSYPDHRGIPFQIDWYNSDSGAHNSVLIKPSSLPKFKADNWCKSSEEMHGFDFREVELLGIHAANAAHALNTITSSRVYVDSIYILLCIRMLFEETGIAMRFQLKSIKSIMSDVQADEYVKTLELKPLLRCEDQGSVMLCAVYEATLENVYLPISLSAVH